MATMTKHLWMVLPLAGLGCGTLAGGPSSGHPTSVVFVAGQTATDTIGAALVQALVVQIPGAPAGTVVRFEGGPVSGPEPFVLVAAVGSGPFDATTVDTIGTDGRALARVKLGGLIGTARLRILVPEFGLQGSALYTIQAGRVALVLGAPHDSALLVGGRYPIRVRSWDRASNIVPDQTTLTSLDPNLTIVGGEVVAGSIGRGRILVRSATGLTDTTFVSVVPDGILSAFSNQGWVLFHTDGSLIQQRPTPQGGNAGFTANWAPDALTQVIDQSAGPLRVLDLTGAVRNLPWPGNTTELYPSYSADGTWIYFARGDTAGFTIHRVHPDGLGDTTVIALSGNDVAPAPAPDGNRIAYTINGPMDLRLYDLRTRSTTRLGRGHIPAWSPDGTRIAFLDDDIGIMNADGTGIRRLTQGQHLQLGFDWSPDGKWIVADGSPYSLVLIDVSTGAVLPLGYSSGWATPSWKPH